jgi:glycine cleavage system H protein
MKKYTKTHEWLEVNGEHGTVGITEHAASELGDITYVEPPSVGRDMILGDNIGVVESVKAASDIFAPTSGTVSSVNKRLDDDPGLVNRSPENEGWIFKLSNIDFVEINDLLTKEQYDKLFKKEQKK